MRISRRSWIASALAAFAAPRAGAATRDGGMATDTEMFRTVIDMWRFGIASRYGYRMPGTPEDHRAAQYVRRRFQRAGLKNVVFERSPIPVAFPDHWRLEVDGGAGWRKVPCYFLRYARFTGPEGIEGDLIHVGQGLDADLDRLGLTDLRGKIVLVDIETGVRDYGAQAHGALFVADANKSIRTADYSLGLPFLNYPAAVVAAARRGAAGLIGILTFRADGDNEEYHGLKEDNHRITGLTVDPVAGADLRRQAAAGARARLTLTERSDLPTGEGHTFNIYGSVPGRTNETIVVMSHHDGGATNEGSGVAEVIALAEHFARAPRRRRKTLVFFLIGSHFGLRYDLATQAPHLVALRDRIGCIMNIEMIARQVALRNGAYVPEPLVAPQGINITGGAPRLLAIVRAAIGRQSLDRVIVTPQLAGEGAHMAQFGMGPVIERIALNAPQFSRADTPQTVMREALAVNARVFADIVEALDPVPLTELQALNAAVGAAGFLTGEARAHDTVERGRYQEQRRCACTIS